MAPTAATPTELGPWVELWVYKYGVGWGHLAPNFWLEPNFGFLNMQNDIASANVPFYNSNELLHRLVRHTTPKYHSLDMCCAPC